MVERNWNFFPRWYYREAMAAQDTELWRPDMLLDAAFNLLAVLAGLNRLYLTRFELKRMRALIAEMALALTELTEKLREQHRYLTTAAGKIEEHEETLVKLRLANETLRGEIDCLRERGEQPE